MLRSPCAEQVQQVILEPADHEWTWLDAIQGTLGEDFLAERNQPPHQEREDLDSLFA